MNMQIPERPFSARLVMSKDLNPANTLFGGRALEWLDEEAALFTMQTLNRERIVTKSITEINFIAPARSGSYLEFYFKALEMSTTAIVVGAKIFRRSFTETGPTLLLECKLVFVAVDENGKKTPHGKTIADTF